ncbi:hypothetical protein, conserved [Plasmodium gonderi]|uniref:Uncharacterized protein n=1 Tax=Plasmodium gonderi TaxID=77519 RepID=A0A1Y1J9P8_PLAGO|nr:hypothetical protein, conserved [Plasmodium gonderi]GAW79221.1 hypothetical protein, conserved [Plasmodium gonderi]
MLKRYELIRRRIVTIKGYSKGADKNSPLNDESLKKAFEKISIGSSPPRAKINSILNFLLTSNILNSNWSKLQIIDELYKRKMDKKLLFHLNVLYGLGSKGINLRKKGIISPILFYPLLDYGQFAYIVQVMKIADKEKQLGIHIHEDFIQNFFKK